MEIYPRVYWYNGKRNMNKNIEQTRLRSHKKKYCEFRDFYFIF